MWPSPVLIRIRPEIGLRVDVAVARVNVEVEILGNTNVDPHRTVAAAEERKIEVRHLDADGDVVAFLVLVDADVAGPILKPSAVTWASICPGRRRGY